MSTTPSGQARSLASATSFLIGFDSDVMGSIQFTSRIQSKEGMSRTSLSQGEARRIALAAQGFDRPRPSGPVNARDLRRTIRQLGLLQIDYVNVLAPAHYQVLFSRLGPY